MRASLQQLSHPAIPSLITIKLRLSLVDIYYHFSLLQAVCNPASLALIADYFDATDRSKALSFYHFGVYVGKLIFFSMYLGQSQHYQFYYVPSGLLPTDHDLLSMSHLYLVLLQSVILDKCSHLGCMYCDCQLFVANSKCPFFMCFSCSLCLDRRICWLCSLCCNNLFLLEVGLWHPYNLFCCLYPFGSFHPP